MEKNMIDAGSGGALVDKTLEAAQVLIANMASNSQQFGVRVDYSQTRVNKVNVSSLEKRLDDLKSLV